VRSLISTLGGRIMSAIDHFKEHFHTITDKRQSAKVSYSLFDVLFGSLCAVIAGAKGWFDIRECLPGHHEWFRRNKKILYVTALQVSNLL
jgi:putative component of toxin-antitoxin plasmid stabilization module